jgi:phospholipid transport system substrate-binding protein
MRALITLLLLSALSLSPAAAAAVEESATAALKARDAEIRAALPPSGGELDPARRRKIENIITRAVDVHGMVEAAMGAKWKQITEAQRRRLVAAFENRFRSTSGGELDTYRSTQIEYRDEVPNGQGVVQVPTRVVVKGEPTDITYALKRTKDGWRIVDLVVDGVSTVANYRSSFARVISKEGVEGLIKRLERGPASSKH